MPTLTIQGTNTDDSMMSSLLPTNNYGSSDGMNLGLSQAKGADKLRDILSFSLGGTIQVNVRVLYALLTLYCSSVSTGGKAAKASRVLRTDWVEGQVTWERYSGTGSCPGAGCWTTAGCDDDGTDYTSTDETSFTTPTSTGSFDIGGDATLQAQVQKAVDDNISPNRTVHIRLKQNQETGGENVVTIKSSEHADTSDRPKLTVIYRRRVQIAVLPAWLQFLGLGLGFVLYRRMVLVQGEKERFFHGTWQEYKRWLRGL